MPFFDSHLFQVMEMLQEKIYVVSLIALWKNYFSVVKILVLRLITFSEEMC
jgi:hypothetical protein